jgi:plasmid maintenance system antidote protein VapI
MSEELAEAVREILDAVPGSDLELARRADVPQSTISRIRTSKRGCTPEVARKLEQALDRWSKDCAAARDHLRRALDAEEA